MKMHLLPSWGRKILLGLADYFEKHEVVYVGSAEQSPVLPLYELVEQRWW